MDMLNRDRADLIAPGFVEDYLALNWLECRGDRGLRLTSSGAALCLQIAAQAYQHSPVPRSNCGWSNDGTRDESSNSMQ